MVALAVAVFGIREPAQHERSAKARVRLQEVTAAAPIFAVMLALHFCLFFVFSGMESTFALWCDHVLGMGPRQVGYYLAFAGVCGAFVQGWLVGHLVARMGEPMVFCIAVVTLAAGLAILPTTDTRPMLLLPIALLSIGFGLANPSLLSLMSRAAPDTIRGGALGLSQSAASLGRILGPTWGGFAFAAVGVAWPFFSGALMLGPVLVLSFILLKRFERAG
jgi:predicted MFS family arabinose efflux permease